MFDIFGLGAVARHGTFRGTLKPVPSLQKTAAILLAAGGGSRFHGSSHKLLADLHGRPVYQWALDVVSNVGFGHIIVVTGAVQLELAKAIVCVHNPLWESGQMSSLRAGLDRAAALGARAAVVGLGDQPFLDEQAWHDVGAHDSPITVATYDGRRGHPVRLANSVWPLLGDEADQGARSLMRNAPHLVVEIACTGSPADIDTMEDLQQWNSSTNSSLIDQSTRRGP